MISSLARDLVRVPLFLIGAMHGAGAHAADRVDMDFFSVKPPEGWRVEMDKGKRLIAFKAAGFAPPLLVIEACKAGSGKPCPEACDLPAIEGSGMIPPSRPALESVARTDGYSEYAGAEEESSNDGTTYLALRILCGPAGYLDLSVLDDTSAQQARQYLDAILGTITWNRRTAEK